MEKDFTADKPYVGGRPPGIVETKPRKPGGGRKPGEATVLRRRLIEDKLDEAEASFAFLVAVRDNEGEPTGYRVDAAKEILNRVLGRALDVGTGEQDKRFAKYFARLDKFLNEVEDETPATETT